MPQPRQARPGVWNCSCDVFSWRAEHKWCVMCSMVTEPGAATDAPEVFLFRVRPKGTLLRTSRMSLDGGPGRRATEARFDGRARRISSAFAGDRAWRSPGVRAPV